MRLLPFDNDLRHRIHVPYDPEYPSIFKKVAEYVESELPSVKLIHIGSTAIFGISGKPMIDAIAITQADLRKTQCEFMRIGFFRRDVWTDLDEKPYVCASIEHGQNRYNFNIHICKTGDSNHKDFVAFRDLLNINSTLRDEYQKAKMYAHDMDPEDPQRYNQLKEPAIKKIMETINL